MEKDSFLFKDRESHQPATKRGILSAVSSLYDPMGFVYPVVLEAKKILQRLWKLNLGWDDLIPEDLQSLWNSLRGRRLKGKGQGVLGARETRFSRV